MCRALLENNSPEYLMLFFLFIGHFAFFMPFSSNGLLQTAQLESEMMDAVDQACLEIWHHTEGWLNNSEYKLFYCVSKH